LPVSQIEQIFADCRVPGSPGASVIVIHHRKVVYRNGFGLANLEEKIPVRPETNFRLASVTKQFTAMAVMILVERRRLRYDQNLREFFPELPAWAESITIRQLLNHTSGIPGYAGPNQHGSLDNVTPDKQLKDRDVIEILRTREQPLFEAGARYEYSNSGYVVLGLIVEKASGLSFAQFLGRNIFRPLKMKGTVAHQEGISMVRNRAYGYMKEQGRWVRRDQSIASALLGDGGVYSSADDLAKWDAGLRAGRLVKPETWRQAVTPGRLNDGTPISVTRDKEKGDKVSYGFGWELATYDGEPAWRHGGGTIAFASYILRLPKQELTVVVLENRLDLNPRAAAYKIAELVLHDVAPPRAARNPATGQ
jgi:CubicO group peptidase (beta-lactamase class C family)